MIWISTSLPLTNEAWGKGVVPASSELECGHDREQKSCGQQVPLRQQSDRRRVIPGKQSITHGSQVTILAGTLSVYGRSRS